QSLARELAPEVRVNAIAPGPVEFPEDLTDEMKQEIVEKTLLKRRGSPEDVARAVLFFATEAPFVTGQVLAVDGGRSANT
ncbi:MAG: SDR family oxidoreductase, partial [Pseudomonadota bacterium]